MDCPNTPNPTPQFPIAQMPLGDTVSKSLPPLPDLATDLNAVIARYNAPLTEQSRQNRRQDLMACYEKFITTARDNIKTAFLAGTLTGAETVWANAHVTDILLQTIYATESQIHQNTQSHHHAITIMATGGYGRGELAPQSDVDILFLTTDTPHPDAEQVINDFMYILWDLRIKVGHSVRSITQTISDAGTDTVLRTSLLDTRYVAGDTALYESLNSQFQTATATWDKTEFFNAKLAEWDTRHTQTGDTRYRLEPNIKTGKGGMRDLHTLYWLAKYIFNAPHVEQLEQHGIFTTDEITRFATAQEFLWTLRCHLHYATGRATEILNFDTQTELAQNLYGKPQNQTPKQNAERLMQQYFLTVRDVGLLTGIFISAVRTHLSPQTHTTKSCGDYTQTGNHLTLTQNQIDSSPHHMVHIFAIAVQNGLDIHPKTLQLLNRNLPQLSPLQNDPSILNTFLSILCCPTHNPAIILGRMNDCGVLATILPDFAPIVAQMQYNMYHHYTTDEHTIRAISTLWKLEHGHMTDDFPVVSTVIPEITNRPVLYVATLLHDIAKGRDGDHSILGAETARTLCPKLGFNADDTALIAWLIENHLYMSNMAFRRDLGDRTTIRQFTEQVQSRDKLQLLYCLTAVDIYSVGENVWSSWKAGLLHTLYYIAEGTITGTISNQQKLTDMATHKANTIRTTSTHPDSMVNAFLNAIPTSYLVTTPVPELLSQIDMVAQDASDNEKIHISWHTDTETQTTTLRIHTQDFAGLFNRITGAVSGCNVSIMTARSINLHNGTTMTVLHLQDFDNNPLDHKSRGNRIEHTIIGALSGEINISKTVATAGKRYNPMAQSFHVPPRVIIRENASETHTVIECQGRDRIGLLYDITTALLNTRTKLDDAHIITYGERAVDTFYLQTPTGKKITDPKHLAQIQEQVLQIL